MLTPQADTAEASARADLHSPATRLARGLARSRAGLVSDALADLDGLRADAWDRLTDRDRAALLATSAECRLARGEMALALHLGDGLAPLLDRPGRAGATAHHGRGTLAAAAGDADRAAAHFARAGRLVAGGTEDPAALPWRTAAAVAAVRLGRRAEAAALAREHLALAQAAHSPYAVALGLRAVATVEAHGNRTTLLREARAVLAGTPAAHLAAQVDTDLAGLLLLSGDRSAA